MDQLRHHLWQRTVQLVAIEISRFRFHELAYQEPLLKRAKAERVEPRDSAPSAQFLCPSPLLPSLKTRLRPQKNRRLWPADFPTEDSQKSCKFEVAEQAKPQPTPRLLPPMMMIMMMLMMMRREVMRRMRIPSKLQRICEPKGVSEKVEADGLLVQQWKAKGHSRTQLVQGMTDAISWSHPHLNYAGRLLQQAEAVQEDGAFPEKGGFYSVAQGEPQLTLYGTCMCRCV